ncbi:M15 family metallopeptidase [Kribbella ginsengisoli]|uniref:Peptidase M15C domain-containing protein n=1 Tax=Kribbella ginsengisoli TaxID=363865 RepID=A0ABP6XPA2_9ACTN
MTAEIAGLSGFTRRSVLTAAVAVAVVGVLPELAAGRAFAVPVSVLGDARPWSATGRTSSANGWPIDRVPLSTAAVQGADAELTVLADPDVSVVLQYVARRFHYEVAEIRAGELVGFKPLGRFASQHESNHCSGTAIDLLPGHFPAGLRGGLYPWQMLVVRDILAQCGGVIRWGADYRDSVDEGHFQIDVPPGDRRLKDLAAVLRGYTELPGKGAGTGEEIPFSSAAVRRSADFHRRQGVVS